jgi:HEAT repeat protein
MQAREALPAIVRLLDRFDRLPGRCMEMALAAASWFGLPLQRRGPACVAALGAIGDPSVVPRLQELARHRSHEVRIAAHEALEAFKLRGQAGLQLFNVDVTERVAAP